LKFGSLIPRQKLPVFVAGFIVVKRSRRYSSPFWATEGRQSPQECNRKLYTGLLELFPEGRRELPETGGQSSLACPCEASLCTTIDDRINCGSNPAPILDSSFVGEDATDLIDYVSYRARAVPGQDLAGSVPDLTVAHALIGRSHCAAFLRRLTFETGNRS